MIKQWKAHVNFKIWFKPPNLSLLWHRTGLTQWLNLILICQLQFLNLSTHQTLSCSLQSFLWCIQIRIPGTQMSRILHSFCMEMPAPGGKLEKIWRIFFLCFFLSKVLWCWFLATIKVAFKYNFKYFYCHKFPLCVKMHIKCGVAFGCCCVLVQVVSVFCLRINTENYTPMCFIFVADASNITRVLTQLLKDTPGTLRRSLRATSSRKKKIPILIEVSTERTQMTNWDCTTTKDNVYTEISFLKARWPKCMFWKALQQASSPKELHSRWINTSWIFLLQHKLLFFTKD